MLTNQQKEDILTLIEEEKERLGQYRAVARKCGVSEATISQLRKGTYLGETDAILQNIGTTLGYVFDDGSWKIADGITNYQIITDVLNDAKNESMFMGISHRAGSGKTVTTDVYTKLNKRSGVFKITTKEWNGRYFLLQLAIELGADIPKGYTTINQLVDAISDTVRSIARTKPLIIVDQANSLKPSALRTFIHLFNQTEDILGVVILGTDNLETEIKRGVRLNRLGYDEFDSRFGRRYIHLFGATLTDTRKICAVNGIEDTATQERIFRDSDPVQITTEDGKSLKVVEDIRRIKRLVKTELLTRKNYV